MRSPSLRLRLSRSSAHKNHVAPTKYAAITIVQSVNGSVILIVTSNSGSSKTPSLPTGVSSERPGDKRKLAFRSGVFHRRNEAATSSLKPPGLRTRLLKWWKSGPSRQISAFAQPSVAASTASIAL
jgi:hypothetical protein